MKSIGKYQIIEALGSSATAETYRVLDTFRHRESAVKVLKTVPNLTTEAKQQFCDYLSSCSELTHRHIAKINDLGEVEEGIFVVTDWRSGTDLRQFMDRHSDLPLEQKLGILAQVAEGLAFAHSRGIAHGNLKPGNIFVDASREASIVDFGIAKWVGALIEAGCRPEGLLPNYLAPEQVLGQTFDARSDIFALGLMLYEFAAGKYPFSSEAGLIPRDIVHSEPAALVTRNPQVPQELEHLVEHALRKDPGERLQTAEEFASGLYVAAQRLRRNAAAPPAEEPRAEASNDSGIARELAPSSAAMEPAMEVPPEAPVSAAMPAAVQSQVQGPAQPELLAQIPPALAPAFESPAQQPNLQFPALEIPVTPRERPQDAEPKQRPWTARSYAMSRLSNDAPPARPAAPPIEEYPAVDIEAPKPPAARTRPLPPPMAAPEFVPPQSFLQQPPPAPPPAPLKAHKMAKAVLAGLAGLIFAVILVGTFLARQNLKASQSRNRIVAVPPAPVEQSVKPVAPKPAPTTTETVASSPAPKEKDEALNPEVSARQVLNGPVRTLWESGRYAQAMTLVDRLLSADPANEAALAWKKKIREAQAAESALK